MLAAVMLLCNSLTSILTVVYKFLVGGRNFISRRRCIKNWKSISFDSLFFVLYQRHRTNIAKIQTQLINTTLRQSSVSTALSILYKKLTNCFNLMKNLLASEKTSRRTYYKKGHIQQVVPNVLKQFRSTLHYFSQRKLSMSVQQIASVHLLMVVFHSVEWTSVSLWLRILFETETEIASLISFPSKLRTDCNEKTTFASRLALCDKLLDLYYFWLGWTRGNLLFCPIVSSLEPLSAFLIAVSHDRVTLCTSVLIDMCSVIKTTNAKFASII